MPWPTLKITYFFLVTHPFNEFFLTIKVHIFWEDHKFLRNLHRKFVLCSNGQIYGRDFAKFCGLLRIYELYPDIFLSEIWVSLLLNFFTHKFNFLIPTSKSFFSLVNFNFWSPTYLVFTIEVSHVTYLITAHGYFTQEIIQKFVYLYSVFGGKLLDNCKCFMTCFIKFLMSFK